MSKPLKSWVIPMLILAAGPLVHRPAFTQEPPFFNLVGFATVNGGTTGGSGGDVITVTSGTGLQDALKEKQDVTNPLTIFVEGTINLDNSEGLSKIDVKDVNDVSIIGAPPFGEFDGIGIKITRASNIIIRNLKIHHVLSGEKDCISIEGPADHIWVDHCELYNEYQGVDKDYYDGLLDAKAEAEYLTYSWNYLHDSWKTALVGSSEGDVFDRKLTMHNNYFYNCNSRLPLFRGSTGHFFNNYFKDIASTTINSRINACVRIEKNYFENAQNPWVSAYSDVLGGGEIIDNILVNSPFVYSDDTRELPECTPVIPYEYASVLHEAASVPDLVMEYAGVGKIQTGPDPVYFIGTAVQGEGMVTTDPEKPYYDSGEIVLVTAVPDTDWEFGWWSGSLSGQANPDSLVMNENKTVTAHFTTNKLQLIHHVSGPGELLIQPLEKPLYDPGESVTLQAVPDEGAYFLEWTGDLSGSENPVEITMDSYMEITAVFRFEETDVLEVQVEESFCRLNGSVETEHAGFTGTGFIDFENETGSDLEIAVDLLSSSLCTLVVRYAHGKTDDRQMEVRVNGSVRIGSLDFLPTGSFTMWDTVSFILDLPAGNSLIRFVALTGNGGPNVDMVRLETTGLLLSPGFCNDLPAVIPPMDINEWSIFPNPASGKVSLIGLNSPQGPVRVTLTDLSGRCAELYSGTALADGHAQRIELDVSSYEPGIYALRVETTGGVKTLRMLVVR